MLGSNLVAWWCAVVALMMSQYALGEQRGSRMQRQSMDQLEGRALQVATLDGSVVDPILVDYLDQFDVLQNAIDNAENGTDLSASLETEMTFVSSAVNNLMSGYATFLPPQPTTTADSGIAAANPTLTGDTSIVIPASQTLVRTASPSVTVAAGGGSATRSLTTIRGPQQTALGSTDQVSNVPSNGARSLAAWSLTLLVPVGILGVSMSV